MNNDDIVYIKDSPDIYWNEVRLFQAILNNAMFEATQKTTPKKIKRSAIEWLSSQNNELLDLCCFLSGVSTADIKKVLYEVETQKRMILRKGVV